MECKTIYKVCYRNKSGEELPVGYYTDYNKAENKCSQLNALGFPLSGRKYGWSLGIAEINMEIDDGEVISWKE